MIVVYSSDENYAQHMAVSMVSLFRIHTKVEKLSVFVISNGISKACCTKLEVLAKSYNRTITWLDFKPFEEKLSLDMEWPISISSYARLFLAEMLPHWCDRVLYLDCDTIVCDDLTALWELDMQEHPVAGVKDTVNADFKRRVGLSPNDPYINAGILLIDLDLWRKHDIQNQFLSFINQRNGRVTHHDQGVINGVFSQNKLILSPRYNAMTPLFTHSYKRLVEFFRLNDFYSESQIMDAVRKPAIIHFTPEYVGRVWEKGCKHPHVDLYRNYLEQTPWKGNITDPEPLSLKLRILYWMYQNLPIRLIHILTAFRKK